MKRLVTVVLPLAFVIATVGACQESPQRESRTSAAPSAIESTTTSPAPTLADGADGADGKVREVPDQQWRAMVAAGMVRPGCPVTQQSELRRVDINHWHFNGSVRRGHLIVRADVAESVVRIFTRLFEQQFPIRLMQGVERYEGDVNASLRADNTSAYNCRRPDQINAPPLKSPHANGRAIDINPRENPWKDPRCECWMPSPEMAAREPAPGVIIRGGPVWQAFHDEGWLWQNIDVPDYMHFDTGYPSKPFAP